MTAPIPTDPTARIPVRSRVAQATPGEPGPFTPPRGPGGQSHRGEAVSSGAATRDATPPEPGLTGAGTPVNGPGVPAIASPPVRSSQPRAAGRPSPATGAGSRDGGGTAPVPGVAPQTPAGAPLDADSGVLAGSTDDQRAAQRKDWQRAQSALKHRQRSQRGRYTRVADRSTGGQFRPGMSRRMPPAGGETS